MNTKPSFLQTTLTWTLPQVRAWLDGLVIGEPVQGEHFNWDGFAFTAAARAREERSLGWAHIALLIYGALAVRPPGGSTHSIMSSAMSLRAWMIEELGAREGDAVLDPEIIHDWFLELADIPLEEAARIANLPDWNVVPTKMLLKLRYIKSALNTLSTIADSGVTQRHPELHVWLLLRERLP